MLRGMADISIPEWDIADRMRKALRVAGLSVQEIADYLGVSRNSVGAWINGRIEPSTQTLRLWAMRTGVDYEWLRDGKPQVEGGIIAV
jgi:transcriptional regulator with XRE-family HTH domain